METPKRMKLTKDGFQQLEEGISLVLSRWRELLDAVERTWGGPHSQQKANDFLLSVIDFFRKGQVSPSIDDLQDLLDDGMDSFSLMEVHSVKEVAKILMDMYQECLENNYQRIQKLRESATTYQRIQKSKEIPPPYVRKASGTSDGAAENHQGSSMTASLSASLLARAGELDEGASQAAELDQARWFTVASKKMKRRQEGASRAVELDEGASQAAELDQAPWITVASKKMKRGKM